MFSTKTECIHNRYLRFIKTTFMKAFAGFFIVTLTACYSIKPSDLSLNQETNDETALLKQMEIDAIAAEFRMDTAGVAKYMDPAFVNISASEITNKQQELEYMYKNFEQRKQKNHTIDSFYLDHFRADFFDNTAIVTFHIVTTGLENNKRYVDKRTRFYDVWVKRNGNWKLVSMQATKVNY